MNRKFNLLSPENKDYPEDLQHKNGFYENICCNCKEHFFGHKRRVTCKVCSEGAKNTEQQLEPDSQYDLGGLILPGSMWAEP